MSLLLCAGATVYGQTTFAPIAPLAGDTDSAAYGLSGDGTKATGDSFTGTTVFHAYIYDVPSASRTQVTPPAGWTASDVRGRGVDVDATGVHFAGHAKNGSAQQQVFYVGPSETLPVPFLSTGRKGEAKQLRLNSASDPFIVGDCEIQSGSNYVLHGFRWKRSAATGSLDLGDPVTGSNWSQAFSVGFRPGGAFTVAATGSVGWAGGNDKSGACNYYSADSAMYFLGFLENPATAASISLGRGNSRNGQYIVGNSRYTGTFCGSSRMAFRVNVDEGQGMYHVIVAGPNGIAETTAVAPNRQAKAVGTTGLSEKTSVVEVVEAAGTYGLVTVPAGDDYILDVGLGFVAGHEGFSSGLAVSNDGQVVVGHARLLDPIPAGSCTWGEPNYVAIVWDPAHGMRLVKDVLAAEGVDMTGWLLIDAVAVSDLGTTIVGNGTYDADGAGPNPPVNRGWVAKIPSLNAAWACCAVDGTCQELPVGLCTGTSVFHPDQTCGEVACPVLTGACCTPADGSCAITIEQICTAMGKTFQGAGTTCETAACPTPCNVPFADADGDTDVDVDDFGTLQACFNLPGTDDCRCFDRDKSGLVDGIEFVEFVKCATGAGVPWSAELTPDCVPGNGLFP